MTTVCSPSLVPLYDDLSVLLSAVVDPLFPAQITLPSPVWPTITSVAMELEASVTAMLDSQFVGLIAELLTVLTDFLSIDLEDILPDIPGLPGFNLINLLNMELDDLIEAVKQSGFDFSLITLLTNPIYSNIKSIDFDALAAVQASITEYYQILTGTTIFDLIALVTDNLQIPGMPSLPVFPTLDSVLALLPPVPTINDLFAISIPGFVFSLLMPQPLMINVNIPAYDFSQGLKNLFTGLNGEVITLILDFVDDLPLTFNLPIFCLEV